MKKLTKDNMAYVYAGIISINPIFPDCVHKLIIKNWGKKGLSDIKKRAWKILERISEMEIALI